MRRHDREVTDPSSILDIIEAADSCRLALIDDSGPSLSPYLVALNFGYEPAGEHGLFGTFWFHGAKTGRKLDLIRRRPEACVELDTEHQAVKNALGCGWGMKYASVFANGKARIVEDPTERRRGIDCLMDHYLRLWGPPEGSSTTPLPIEDRVLATTTVFCLNVESLSAKRKP
jgi:nitroimidazol reductase NimA-like FMN-containing flavoprotein (pyridoxamine 5'-phosphate oxidase superfamily)